MDQPIPEAGRRGEGAGEVRREDAQLPQLDEAAVVVLGDRATELGDQVRVDVEGCLDRFLEQALGGLALVQARSILVEAQARERAQSVERCHDAPELPPDDRRIYRAHANPSRSRKTRIARRWAARSLAVSQ